MLVTVLTLLELHKKILILCINVLNLMFNIATLAQNSKTENTAILKTHLNF